MKALLSALILAAGLALPVLAQDAPPETPAGTSEQAAAAPARDAAVLQGLDKITARISTFSAPIGEPVMFGSLQITARTCHKTPPEELPERTVFLEIVDARPDSPERTLFSGWMFASSPAVSALEHPVYDVWVIDCTKASTSSSETSTGN